MSKGWECPKCGKVWAPHRAGCENCNDRTVQEQVAAGLCGGGMLAEQARAFKNECAHEWVGMTGAGATHCRKCGAKAPFMPTG